MSLKNRHQASAQARFDIDAQFQNALALQRQGQFAKAEKLYEGILRQAPAHFGALNLLGVIACQKRTYERAVELIAKAISINPNVAPAHSNLGVVLKEMGRFADALASYDKAIALKADYGRAYYNRAIVLKELGRLEEALASYDRATEFEPDAEAYYNRANVLRELRRFEDAAESYSRAIELNPHHLDALLNCGNALKELGRMDRALASYDRAVALRPDCVDAHRNRAIALSELGRLHEALAPLEKLLALQPTDHEAHCSRANILGRLDRFEEALASCERAIALKPDFADAYLNRGIILRELDLLDEARASFQKAVFIKPDFAGAFNNLGLTLKELGKLNEARIAFLRAIDIDPRDASAYFNLALSKTFQPNDPDIEKMKELTDEFADPSKEAHVQLHFALAKAYEDFRDYPSSFTHLITANQAKRKAIAYDERTAFVRFESIETAFNRDSFQAKSEMGNPSRVPIFVLGMPRSGTTLIEQILASHPMVHGAGELEALNQIVREPRNVRGLSLQYPFFIPSLERSDLIDIGERYLAAIARRAHVADRVTDKMPGNFFHVGLIHLALPNAKIIHTMRDPVDTCVSCFSKLFTHGQEFTYDLGELGRFYKRYEHLMAHWRSVLPPGRMFEVQYEDVVDDLEMQARRILDYCELPWDDRCLSFHETQRPVRTASLTQVRQPIYKSAVGRWREYEEFLGPLLEALEIKSA